MSQGTLEEVLVLASASPRRHEILQAAGIEHLVRPSTVPEDRRSGEDPLAYVKRLAEEKARAVDRGRGEIILGADTTVCLEIGSEVLVLGKPADEQDAARMLRLLSGRRHVVHTGICLISKRDAIVDAASTYVQFVPLADEEVWEYTRSGEPADKAGAYAIQGLASKFVSSIDGCYHNVVGLPVSLVYRRLKDLAP